MAVRFEFDFSLDATGFFAAAARRDILGLAGRMIGERLNDRLNSLTPGGSNTWTVGVTNPATGRTRTFTNPTLPANTIRIYVGARDLPGSRLGIGGGGAQSFSGDDAWLDRVATRGQSGVKTGTDVAPSITSIAFDSVGTRWHFGRTQAGLERNESDFLSVALHEICHVIGINSGNPSWTRWISSGRFQGPEVKAANNDLSVAVSPDGRHFADGTTSDQGLEMAMDPTLTRGTRKLLTTLDFAALKDVGWSVNSIDDTITRATHKLTYRPDGVLDAGASVLIPFARLSHSRDVDMYRVYVTAGTTLSARVSPHSSGVDVDTFIRLFDTAGAQLKTADQGGTGGIDTLTYTVTRSDYYYVAVSSFGNRKYNANFINSGPGGPIGEYQMVISAE